MAADGRGLVKCCPITSVVITKTVKRTKQQEVVRLRGRFSANKLKAVFPGANPELPMTFEAALDMADQVSVPSAMLMTMDLATP